MRNQPEKSKKTRRISRLQILIYIGGLLPLIFLVIAYLSGNLGFNPVEMFIRRTGQMAVVFLLLSLTCTPVSLIFKFPPIGKLRKPLGLLAAFYAVLHFAAFMIWDYRLDLNLIWLEITGRPFILIGAAALIILIVLAATSFPFFQRKLGKWWKHLHSLVYAAGLLAGMHYLLSVKGNLFNLQGAYGPPLAAGGFLILLLILRLPIIYLPLQRLIRQTNTKK